MLRSTTRIGLMIFACCLAYSQTFDAASVKPAPPPARDSNGRTLFHFATGGPGTKDPGRIHYPYSTMKSLLMSAYDVKDFQLAGPAWLDTERFDITATMAPDTSKEQFRTMLQNLLAERFQMTIHRETKELPEYSLTVAKGGPKMKESAATAPVKADGDTAPPPPLLPVQPKIGPDGFPILPQLAGHGGLFTQIMPGRTRLIGQKQSVRDLATRLTDLLSRPVTDATALTAKYDFTLTFSLDGLNVGGPIGALPAASPGGGSAAVSAPDGEAPPDLFEAVQAQLGLKLESKKGAVEMIVIDHIEKTPVDN